ncbi:hypothetical protein ACQV2T_04160 [Facklamia sp. P13069]|uniref:hypothetical protein n=1 Tax=Facklamia sp. P13069 TaxID=3421954 RepID=UPI003D174E09
MTRPRVIDIECDGSDCDCSLLGKARIWLKARLFELKYYINPITVQLIYKNKPFGEKLKYRVRVKIVF